MQVQAALAAANEAWAEEIYAGVDSLTQQARTALELQLSNQVSAAVIETRGAADQAGRDHADNLRQVCLSYAIHHASMLVWYDDGPANAWLSFQGCHLQDDNCTKSLPPEVRLFIEH